MTAFNRKPEGVSRPATFYIGFPIHRIIAYPIRPLEPKRDFLPILYCDTWGDFWMNFLIYGQNKKGHYMQGNYLTRPLPLVKRPVVTNMRKITPYLRRVMVFAILPTLVLIAGVVTGAMAIVRMARTRTSGADPPDVASVTGAFAAAVVLSTFAGYLWFISNYTDRSGDTIKASYILQTYPFLALMAAAFLRGLLDRTPAVAATIIVFVVGVTAHNVPAMFTNYERDSDDACCTPAAATPTTAPATGPATPPASTAESDAS
jgi:hypothetical protein